MADADSTGPAADAVDFNQQFVNTIDAYLLKVRATFSLPLDNVSDDALAQAVYGYQRDSALSSVDGKLNPETVDRLNAINRLGSTDWAADLDTRDEQGVQGVIDQAEALRNDPNVTLDQLRSSIIQVATSQIGTVNAANRGDGRIYGGRRLVKYFGVVTAQVPESEITTPGMPQHSWCGIFAVWATNVAAGKGWWGLDGDVWGPLGVSKVAISEDPNLNNLLPGDIVAIPEFQHQFIFVQRDGDELVSIDGNGDWQVVHWARHPVSDVVAYYPIVR